MPNWVLNKISVEEQYAEKLKEISEVGIGRYYSPMPEELNKTKAPLGFDREEQETAISFLEKYGFRDWYSWAVSNWGTKWGCCKNEFENNTYWYQTAWSPIAFGLIEKLSEDIPSFNYSWEEEQGFGQEWRCEKGRFKMIKEWGLDKF